MYIQRSIDKVLTEWKDERRRKPLLLRGVRQCGKTSAVRELAKSFRNYVEVNLEKQPELNPLFEGDLDVDVIVRRLELTSGERIKAGETLLFIDEIQACPRAIAALRYFYEDKPDLHVIAAGSLLEFVLGNRKNETVAEFPVGRVRSVYMYPLSFMEFLAGTGKGVLAEYLADFDVEHDVNDGHEKLIEAYKDFLVVGGMPEAVTAFVETGSMLESQRVHRDILQSMLDDFDKYNGEISSDVLRNVFRYAMHHVCAQIKSSSAMPDVSGYMFDASVEMLQRAGLVYPVRATSGNIIPPGAGEKDINRKLVVFDTGVYLTERGLDISELLGAEVFDDLNKGTVVEMETGLEMIKYLDSYKAPELFYWYRSGANAKVDYVLYRGEIIYPIEVKSSGSGRMQSLFSYLATHEDVPYGIRISLEDFSQYDKVRVYPVYGVSKI